MEECFEVEREISLDLDGDEGKNKEEFKLLKDDWNSGYQLYHSRWKVGVDGRVF